MHPIVHHRSNATSGDVVPNGESGPAKMREATKFYRRRRACVQASSAARREGVATPNGFSKMVSCGMRLEIFIHMRSAPAVPDVRTRWTSRGSPLVRAIEPRQVSHACAGRSPSAITRSD